MQSAPGLPFLLQTGMEVAFVPPVLDMPRRANVERVSPMADGKAAEVQFSGIDTRDVAEKLVSCFILVRRSELPEGFDAAGAQSPWIGFAVIDYSAGDIGRIVEVIENPGQSLLRVESDSGEVLIPFVDAIIEEIDEEGRCMHADLPQGLLDLAQDDAFDVSVSAGTSAAAGDVSADADASAGAGENR